VCQAGGTCCQAVEVIAVDDVDQVELSALEAQHLDIAVRLNVEPDGVEIRQTASLRILFPVVGIAAQQNARSGLIFSNHEWTENGRFLFGRMRGHDGNLVEQAIDASKWRGKEDGNLVGRNHLRAHGTAAGTESVSGRRVQRRIHQPLHGESNILGREWAAIGKRDAVAELEGDLLAVFRYLPRFGQFGLEVLRFAVSSHQDAAGQVTDR